tara:strand:+ start:348 stop:1487 length:1140 start_codon:yes stop_codon:yes gene_type:complete
MKDIILQNGHIKIYKRESSQFWQMRIKPPKEKAIRESSGCRNLKDAKEIALKKYNLLTLDKKIITLNVKNYHEYKGKHLLGIKNLKKTEIEYIIDYAQQFIEFNKQKVKKSNILEGKSIFNVFFEDSTRTRTSFEIAAKRLGADLINVSVKDSSINKGETLLDTVVTIGSMDPDLLIIRHPEYGVSEMISKTIDASIINAGDGSHEHPTQALLDALTIKNKIGKFRDIKIAICGDILHSRVARSNIYLLKKLGAKINVVGPKTLIPDDINDLGVSVYYDMKNGLKNCDIVMMLRIQKERILGIHIPSEKDYFLEYGLDFNKLKYAKRNALVMHPGPMNRGVEIDSKVADDVTRSLIQNQVSMGVAIRMACLKILIDNKG